MTLRKGITEELKSQIWSRSAVLLQNPFSLTASNSMLILASDTTSQETGSCEAVGLHSSCWGQSCTKSFNHLFLFRGKASKGRQNSSSKDPSTLLIINAHFSVILLLHSYPCLLSPTHNSAWEVRLF